MLLRVLQVPPVPGAHEPVALADVVRLVRGLVQEDAGQPPPVPLLRSKTTDSTAVNIVMIWYRLAREEEEAKPSQVKPS